MTGIPITTLTIAVNVTNLSGGPSLIANSRLILETMEPYDFFESNLEKGRKYIETSDVAHPPKTGKVRLTCCRTLNHGYA